MTTIIYKDNTIGSDSQVSEEHMKIPCVSTKISKLKNGIIIGVSGDADSRELSELLESKDILPTRKELMDTRSDCDIIAIYPDKRVFLLSTVKKEQELECYDADIVELKSNYWAIGSGQKYALGALQAGASIEEALKIACHFDMGSSGPFDFIKF